MLFNTSKLILSKSGQNQLCLILLLTVSICLHWLRPPKKVTDTHCRGFATPTVHIPTLYSSHLPLHCTLCILHTAPARLLQSCLLQISHTRNNFTLFYGFATSPTRQLKIDHHIRTCHDPVTSGVKYDVILVLY